MQVLRARSLSLRSIRIEPEPVVSSAELTYTDIEVYMQADTTVDASNVCTSVRF